MSWLEKLLPPKIQQTDPADRRSVPEGLWMKCDSCQSVLYRAELEKEMLQFTVAPGIPASTFNADRTIHQGLEAGLDWRIVPTLRLRQTWAWSDFDVANGHHRRYTRARARSSSSCALAPASAASAALTAVR